MSKKASSWQFVRIGVYLILLAGFMLYGYRFHPGVTLSDCLDSPQQFDGAIVEIGNEALIDSVYSDGFTITQLGRTVSIHGQNEDLAPGEFVYILARFHAPDSLVARNIRVAKNRRLKMGISVLPTLFVLYYFSRRYRFRFTSFTFVERN